MMKRRADADNRRIMNNKRKDQYEISGSLITYYESKSVSAFIFSVLLL